MVSGAKSEIYFKGNNSRDNATSLHHPLTRLILFDASPVLNKDEYRQ